MGTMKVLTSLMVLLLVDVEPLIAKPTQKRQQMSSTRASKDYYELQTILGKNLEGTAEEKAKAVDLILQLLTEIDLPTLCEVIANDTKGAGKPFDTASIKSAWFNQVHEKATSSIGMPESDLPVSLSQFNTAQITRGVRLAKPEAIPYSRNLATERQWIDETDEPASYRINSWPATQAYLGSEVNTDTYMDRTSKRHEQDASTVTMSYPELPNHSTNQEGEITWISNEFTPSSYDISGDKVTTAAPLSYPIIHKQKIDSLYNLKFNPAYSTNDLKPEIVPSIYIQDTPGESHDNLAHKKLFIKSVGVERANNEFYSQALKLDDWMEDTNTFETNWKSTDHVDKSDKRDAQNVNLYENKEGGTLPAPKNDYGDNTEILAETLKENDFDNQIAQNMDWAFHRKFQNAHDKEKNHGLDFSIKEKTHAHELEDKLGMTKDNLDQVNKLRATKLAKMAELRQRGEISEVYEPKKEKSVEETSENVSSNEAPTFSQTSNVESQLEMNWMLDPGRSDRDEVLKNGFDDNDVIDFDMIEESADDKNKESTSAVEEIQEYLETATPLAESNYFESSRNITQNSGTEKEMKRIMYATRQEYDVTIQDVQRYEVSTNGVSSETTLSLAGTALQVNISTDNATFMYDSSSSGSFQNTTSDMQTSEADDLSVTSISSVPGVSYSNNQSVYQDDDYINEVIDVSQIPAMKEKDTRTTGQKEGDKHWTMTSSLEGDTSIGTNDVTNDPINYEEKSRFEHQQKESPMLFSQENPTAERVILNPAPLHNSTINSTEVLSIYENEKSSVLTESQPFVTTENSADILPGYAKEDSSVFLESHLTITTQNSTGILSVSAKEDNSVFPESHPTVTTEKFSVSISEIEEDPIKAFTSTGMPLVNAETSLHTDTSLISAHINLSHLQTNAREEKGAQVLNLVLNEESRSNVSDGAYTALNQISNDNSSEKMSDIETNEKHNTKNDTWNMPQETSITSIPEDNSYTDALTFADLIVNDTTTADGVHGSMYTDDNHKDSEISFSYNFLGIDINKQDILGFDVPANTTDRIQQSNSYVNSNETDVSMKEGIISQILKDTTNNETVTSGTNELDVEIMPLSTEYQSVISVQNSQSQDSKMTSISPLILVFNSVDNNTDTVNRDETESDVNSATFTASVNQQHPLASHLTDSVNRTMLIGQISESDTRDMKEGEINNRINNNTSIINHDISLVPFAISDVTSLPTENHEPTAQPQNQDSRLSSVSGITDFDEIKIRAERLLNLMYTEFGNHSNRNAVDSEMATGMEKDTTEPIEEYPDNRTRYTESAEEYPDNGTRYTESVEEYPDNRIKYTESIEEYPDNRTRDPESVEEYPANRTRYTESVEEYLNNRTRDPESVEEYPDNRTIYTESVEEYPDNRTRYTESVEEYLNNRTRDPESVEEYPDTTIYTESVAEYPDNRTRYTESAEEYPDNRTRYTESVEEYPDNRTRYTESVEEYPDKRTRDPESVEEYPDNRTRYTESVEEYPDKRTIYTESVEEYPDNRTRYTESFDEYSDNRTSYTESVEEYPGNRTRYTESVEEYPDNRTRYTELIEEYPDNRTRYTESFEEYSDNITRYTELVEEYPDNRTRYTGSLEEYHNNRTRDPESFEEYHDTRTRYTESVEERSDNRTRYTESAEKYPDNRTRYTESVEEYPDNRTRDHESIGKHVDNNPRDWTPFTQAAYIDSADSRDYSSNPGLLKDNDMFTPSPAFISEDLEQQKGLEDKMTSRVKETRGQMTEDLLVAQLDSSINSLGGGLHNEEQSDEDITNISAARMQLINQSSHQESNNLVRQIPRLSHNITLEQLINISSVLANIKANLSAVNMNLLKRLEKKLENKYQSEGSKLPTDIDVRTVEAEQVPLDSSLYSLAPTSTPLGGETAAMLDVLNHTKPQEVVTVNKSDSTQAANETEKFSSDSTTHFGTPTESLKSETGTSSTDIAQIKTTQFVSSTELAKKETPSSGTGTIEPKSAYFVSPIDLIKTETLTSSTNTAQIKTTKVTSDVTGAHRSEGLETSKTLPGLEEDSVKDFDGNMGDYYYGVLDYGDLGSSSNYIFPIDRSYYDNNPRPESNFWNMGLGFFPHYDIKNVHPTKPESHPYMSGFWEWRKPDPTANKLSQLKSSYSDPWKAYNIAVAKQKSREQADRMHTKLSKPEARLFSDYGFGAAAEGNDIDEYLWRARPWSKSAFSREALSSGDWKLPEKKFGQLKEAKLGQLKEAKLENSSKHKLLDTLRFLYTRPDQTVDTDQWTNRFSQAYYGSVFDDQPNIPQPLSWPSFSQDMVNFDTSDRKPFESQGYIRNEALNNQPISLHSNRAFHPIESDYTGLQKVGINNKYPGQKSMLETGTVRSPIHDSVIKGLGLHEYKRHDTGMATPSPHTPQDSGLTTEKSHKPQTTIASLHTPQDSGLTTENSHKPQTTTASLHKKEDTRVLKGEEKLRGSWKKEAAIPPSSPGLPAPNEYNCPGLFGYHSDPTNCQSFFICSWGMPYKVTCPEGTLYNAKEAVCDWAVNVRCPINHDESTNL